MKQKRNERGAVAVEMAIVLPLLLLILIGTMEFGRVFNVQNSLTQAAREGARYAAIHHNDSDFADGDVATVALAAAPSLSNLEILVDDDAGSCASGQNVTVSATVTLGSLSGFLDAGFFGSPGIFPMALEGVGVMRCGG